MQWTAARVIVPIFALTVGGVVSAGAADLPPSPAERAENEPLTRDALRPVPSTWIAGDAATVVDARELVVLTTSEAAADELAGLAIARDYEVMRRDSLPSLRQVLIVLRIPEGRTGPEAIAEIEALQPDATAGVNHAYAMPLRSDALERLQYADTMIGWPASGCRSYVRIGLVDTAIDPDVAEHLGALVQSADFRRDPSRQTGSEHGTALAALLAGKGRLIEPEVFNAVVAGDGSDADDAAGVDDLLRALDWLAGEDVRVVNISLAGPYNKILDLGIQSAAASGLVMVAAVGNDGPAATPRFPAAFDEVVAVTAVDADRQVYPYAVQGSHIDFAAPGVDVAVPLGDEVRFVSGTSVAAPFLTAMLAADPMILGPIEPAQIVADYGEAAKDVGADGRDEVFGFGIPSAASHCP